MYQTRISCRILNLWGIKRIRAALRCVLYAAIYFLDNIFFSIPFSKNTKYI